MKRISIGRCVYENPKQRVLESQLHGFGDASSKAKSMLRMREFMRNC